MLHTAGYIMYKKFKPDMCQNLNIDVYKQIKCMNLTSGIISDKYPCNLFLSKHAKQTHKKTQLNPSIYLTFLAQEPNGHGQWAKKIKPSG